MSYMNKNEPSRVLLAYRGKAGCRSVICTQMPDEDHCHGWHCSHCNAPCSSQGHDCAEASR